MPSAAVSSINVKMFVCPASGSWQGFFLFEGGDGRAGAAEVDFEGPVLGDGFVRAHGVVFDAVVLGSLDECEGVGDVAWEQALVFQCPNPRSRDLFCPGDLTRVRTCRSSGWRMMNSSKFSDRNGPPLSVTIVSTGSSSPVSSLTGQVSTSGCPNMRS